MDWGFSVGKNGVEMFEANHDLERAARIYGGTIDSSLFTPPFSELLNDLVESGNEFIEGLRRHMSHQWKSRQVQIAFTRLPEINARVLPGVECDYLFISIRAIEQLYGTMMGLLASPSFFPQVGDVRVEIDESQELSGSFPPMLFPINGVVPSSARTSLPQDPVRITCAMQLAFIATHFLLFHEIGHILAGHLELYKSQGLREQIAEFVSPAERLPQRPSRAIIECDADAFAAHAQSFLDLQVSTDPLWATDIGWKGMAGANVGFICHATAIHVLFHLLDSGNTPLESPADGDYPHPVVRAALVVERSYSLAVQAKLLSEGDLEMLIGHSIMHVEHVLRKLGMARRNLDNASASRIIELAKQMREEYVRAQSVLEAFGRLPTAWHGSWPVIS